MDRTSDWGREELLIVYFRMAARALPATLALLGAAAGAPTGRLKWRELGVEDKHR